jgi:hypothetical protein
MQNLAAFIAMTLGEALLLELVLLLGLVVLLNIRRLLHTIRYRLGG